MQEFYVTIVRNGELVHSMDVDAASSFDALEVGLDYCIARDMHDVSIRVHPAGRLSTLVYKKID